MGEAVTFTVEQAGCESCAARVHAALSPLGAVEEIAVDGETDEARVRIAGSVVENVVEGALADASEGSGHAYRVKPGSWLVHA